MKFKDISILIPFKSDYGQRDKNWSWVRQRYEKLIPEAEICLGNYPYEPFSRSRAINQAARLATRDIFLIADTDIIFDLNDLTRWLELLSQYTWVIPFSKRYNLTPDKTNWLLQQDYGIDIKNVSLGSLEIIECPGSLNLVPRRYFEVIGGFDTRFEGWGGEDNAFKMAMDTLCGPSINADNVVWHLWHPPANINSNQYQLNYSLYEKYCQASGNRTAMLKLAKNSPPKSSSAQKYRRSTRISRKGK